MTAAVNEARLAEDLETDGALVSKAFRRRLDKGAFVSRVLFLSRRRIVLITGDFHLAVEPTLNLLRRRRKELMFVPRLLSCLSRRTLAVITGTVLTSHFAKACVVRNLALAGLVVSPYWKLLRQGRKALHNHNVVV